MFAVYHRLESPTQTAHDASLQQKSGEIWGKPSRFSHIPKVKAYVGVLPAGRSGVEFETDVQPDAGCPPGQAFWSAGNPGVQQAGDVVILKVKVLKVVS